MSVSLKIINREFFKNFWAFAFKAREFAMEDYKMKNIDIYFAQILFENYKFQQKLLF